MKSLSLVGKGVPRIDAPPKATGGMEFLSDIELPGTLHGRILRSPHAHARILSIDASRAEAARGVRAVITAEDTPKIPFSFVAPQADKLPLCDRRVRFVGDEVAAVAAETEEQAEEALSLIHVEYEELPVVFDPKEAVREDAPLVHEGKERNIAFSINKTYGDPDKGFAEADHVVEDSFVTQRAAHCALETRGCIARWDRTGSNARLTLWASTQAPHTLKEEVARTLDIEPRRIQVIKPPTGGAFGNRMVMDMGLPVARHPGRKNGPAREDRQHADRRVPDLADPVPVPHRSEGRRSVRRPAHSPRRSDLRGQRRLHGQGQRDPQLRGLHVRGSLQRAETSSTMDTSFTPTASRARPFGGFGNPQLTFAAESQMDRMADILGMDPLELRRVNANRAGETSPSGVVLPECQLERCLDTVAESAGWKASRARGGRNGDGGGRFRRGMGLAVMMHSGAGSRYYGYNSAGTFINIARDGQVFLNTPANDTGQGALTIMAQIAAEELGVRMDDMVVIADDTDVVPYDLGNYGSRSTWVCGQAAKAAGEEGRRRIFEAVAEEWEVSVEDLRAEDSEISVAGHPDRTMTFADAASILYDKKGSPITIEGRFEDVVAAGHVDWSNQIPTYSTGCHLVEVEVDTETGNVGHPAVPGRPRRGPRHEPPERGGPD